MVKPMVCAVGLSSAVTAEYFLKNFGFFLLETKNEQGWLLFPDSSTLLFTLWQEDPIKNKSNNIFVVVIGTSPFFPFLESDFWELGHSEVTTSKGKFKMSPQEKEQAQKRL